MHQASSLQSARAGKARSGTVAAPPVVTPAQLQPVTQSKALKHYLNVQPPCDVTALLQKATILPNHAHIYGDVQFLGGEEDIHVVHVLSSTVPTCGEHQHSCQNLKKLLHIADQ